VRVGRQADTEMALLQRPAGAAACARAWGPAAAAPSGRRKCATRNPRAPRTLSPSQEGAACAPLVPAFRLRKPRLSTRRYVGSRTGSRCLPWDLPGTPAAIAMRASGPSKRQPGQTWSPT